MNSFKELNLASKLFDVQNREAKNFTNVEVHDKPMWLLPLKEGKWNFKQLTSCLFERTLKIIMHTVYCSRKVRKLIRKQLF